MYILRYMKLFGFFGNVFGVYCCIYLYVGSLFLNLMVGVIFFFKLMDVIEEVRRFELLLYMSGFFVVIDI